MLTQDEILNKFNSLMDYERFRISWTRSCARVNRKGRNAQLLEASEKRAQALGVEEDGDEDGYVRVV